MNLIFALIPYIAIFLGMYVFHSGWMAILLYHVGVITYLLVRKPVDLWRRMWTGIKSPLLFPGILACALAAPIVYFMWALFAVSDTVLQEWMTLYGLTGWRWLLLMPYFSIVHPCMEEILWRGITSEKGIGLCWQDVLFAGYHILVLFQLIRAPWLIFVFVILVGSSIFWRWTANRFEGYGLAILSHAVADTAAIVGIFFLLRS